MTKRGRTPKPRARRSARTAGPALAVVLRETDPPGMIPAPPDRPDGQPLCDPALRAWDQYWLSPMAGMLDAVAGVDRYTVDRWIQCIDELERVESALRRARFVRGSTGQPALNPLATYARQLRSELTEYQGALGLTPLARARLGITSATEPMTADRVAALLRLLPETSRTSGRD